MSKERLKFPNQDMQGKWYCDDLREDRARKVMSCAQGANVSISEPEVSEWDLRYLFVVHVRAAKKLKRRCLLEPWHMLKRTLLPFPLQNFHLKKNWIALFQIYCRSTHPNMQQAMYVPLGEISKRSLGPYIVHNCLASDPDICTNIVAVVHCTLHRGLSSQIHKYANTNAWLLGPLP